MLFICQHGASIQGRCTMNALPTGIAVAEGIDAVHRFSISACEMDL